jgi:hypothetical protein
LVRSKESRLDESWWLQWPDLLQDELSAFARRQITTRTVYQRNGVLIIDVDWPIQGQSNPMLLRIGFSPLHPFFRPAVAATDKVFERHQNPFTRQLCLLTQETGQWNSRQLVADFVQERLEQLLTVLDAREQGRWEDAAKLEENAADPLMPYFADASEDDSVILFDGAMALPVEGHGLMDVICTSRNGPKNRAAFEGVLQQLKNSGGRAIGKRFAIANGPADLQLVTGHWVKFTPPPMADPAELLRLADQELEKQAVMQAPSVQKVRQAAAGPFSITGIVFPDEAEYGQQKKGAGWLFLATRQNFVHGEAGAAQTRLVRGQRTGTDEIFARLPVAQLLLKKNVLVVGCGAIGSFAGIELARAGVGKLSFVDHDIVEPGNSLRWPLGRTAWGINKGVALANFIAANCPWTKAGALPQQVGVALSDPAWLPPDLKENVLSPLLALLREADLVVDTSASFEVQHALSHLCCELKLPYVMGYATLGVAGGVVARFIPGSKSCLVCLHEHWNDDNNDVPKPRVDNTGIVTPVGCNAPTFTGGGFDLQEVSLEVVRSAVGLLSEGKYDPGTWPVAILTLKEKNGARLLPRWESLECPPHPRCCGAKR